MKPYVEEISYTFFPTVDTNALGYSFDPQSLSFPTCDGIDGLQVENVLYSSPCSYPSYQPPTNLVCATPTLTLDNDHTRNQIAFPTPSPSSDLSPLPIDFIPSPSNSTTPPRSPPKEPETGAGWGPADLHQMGYLDVAGNWRCRYSGCCSSRVFYRACDLRKHFRGHAKYFFCAEKRCQQAGVGFATRKDYQRHMGSHKPAVPCLHPDCDRIFSRKDNMREHYTKIHQRMRSNVAPQRGRQAKHREPPQSALPGISLSTHSFQS